MRTGIGDAPGDRARLSGSMPTAVTGSPTPCSTFFCSPVSGSQTWIACRVPPAVATNARPGSRSRSHRRCRHGRDTRSACWSSRDRPDDRCDAGRRSDSRTRRRAARRRPRRSASRSRKSCFGIARTSVPSAALRTSTAAVVAAGGKQRAVGRHSQRHDAGWSRSGSASSAMAISVPAGMSHSRMPLSVVVGDQPLPPAAKAELLDVPGIGVELGEAASSRRFRPSSVPPEIDEAVLAAGRKERPVRRKGEIVDGVFGRLQDRLDLAGREIEQADIAIGRLVAETRRRNSRRRRSSCRRAKPRRRRSCRHCRRRSSRAACGSVTPALPVPDADRLVVGGRDQILAVAR